METKNLDTYEYLVREMKGAIKSNNRDLVYETYGAACMARQLGAISFD